VLDPSITDDLLGTTVRLIDSIDRLAARLAAQRIELVRFAAALGSSERDDITSGNVWPDNLDDLDDYDDDIAAASRADSISAHPSSFDSNIRRL
jgi:hypothetical protein